MVATAISTAVITRSMPAPVEVAIAAIKARAIVIARAVIVGIRGIAGIVIRRGIQHRSRRRSNSSRTSRYRAQHPTTVDETWRPPERPTTGTGRLTPVLTGNQYAECRASTTFRSAASHVPLRCTHAPSQGSATALPPANQCAIPRRQSASRRLGTALALANPCRSHHRFAAPQFAMAD